MFYQACHEHNLEQLTFVYKLIIDPFHNKFRVGLRFRLDSVKESITRRPMYNVKMLIESIVILSKLFS